MTKTAQVHATCVARRGLAALLQGPPGAGKSDLALRFIEMFADARLVADDRTDLSLRDGALWADAPRPLRGLIEVRGLGLLRRPAATARVGLVVNLIDSDTAARIAEPDHADLLGMAIPALPFWPFGASAPHKLAIALETIGQTGFPGGGGILGSK